MKTLVCLALAAGAIRGASSIRENVKDLAPLVPTKIESFESAGEDRVYDRKTLYDYMDGGAEVILAYDFREVLVRKYNNAGGDEIVLDIYEMGSPAEAYGLFSLDRPAEMEEAGLGQESLFGLGLLKFWQGRYFVSVMTTAADERADKTLLALGRRVVSPLGPPGRPPGLLGLLPAEGLKKGRTSFFHNAVHLNNRFFVASENILNLDARTEAAFAEYASGAGERGGLLLVRYPDEADAGAAGASFRRVFLPGADPDGAALTESRKWTMVRLRKNILAVVFESPKKADAEALLAAVKWETE
jgi:hypothetical protein